MIEERKSIKLKFFDQKVLVRSNSSELLTRISLDFSYFVSEDLDQFDFVFTANYQKNISIKIPSWPEIRRSRNSITYEKGHVRYNDYYGKLISVFDYKNEKGRLYSSSIEKLHEITYLLILSRLGKKLDLLGLHKIHALGITYNKIACVGMMDMGVGKSTLLLKLLEDPSVDLLSDDTPLVNQEGRVLSFPIRIGVNHFPKNLEIIEPEKNLYSLEREHYGLKHLISLKGIVNSVGEDYGELILFEGIRGKGGASRLVPVSKLSIWLSLQKHMVIGIGLPMILEYFWESGPSDFFRKAKILILRELASIKLAKSAAAYKFYMSEKPEENTRVLKNLLDRVAIER